MLEKPKYFRDPIHGFIEVSPLELRIIENPLFQRLRRIKQLGPAYYVFHGATHTRFEHSIGVMSITKKILQNINFADKDEKQKIILAALLHDIGQLPLSHTFEKVVEKEYNISGGHEKYMERIITKSTISDILKDASFSKKDIKDIADYALGRNTNFLFGSQIIHSELDADRMDYLLRDSLFCGVKYGIYDLDRLLMSFVLHTDKQTLVVAKKGIYVAEEFVLARLYMYRQVYIHKTKRAFEIIVSEIMKNLLGDIIYYPTNLTKLDENELIDKDDYWLISEFRSILKNSSNIDERTKKLIKMYLYRKPIKVVDYVEESIDKIDQKFSSKYHLYKNLLKRHDFLKKLPSLNITENDIFIDEPRINVKQYPYKFQPAQFEEEGQIPILIYEKEDSTEPVDIATRRGSIIRNISSKLLGVVRVYTFAEYLNQVKSVLEKIS
ncbi:MAG: HD domain-containing protein [Candidatus Odinarchaeota archaeon]|nr:HD domain-containing protein [Candidatus Odinarchaeota archaeon]